MKTLKLLIVLIATGLLWQQGKAQCVNFSSYSLSLYGDTVRFTPALLSGTTDSALATLSWDFGDGETQVAGGSVVHAYDSAGTYIVCLNYSGPLCTSSYCDTVIVQPCAFIYYNSPLVSQVTTAGITSLSVPGIPSGSTYSWAFGPGSVPATSTVANPQVAFPPQVLYQALTVDILMPDGCPITAYYTINTDTNCNAAWSMSKNYMTIYTGADITVLGTQYNWDFGDGGSQFNTNGNSHAQHTFTAFGIYNVCLSAASAGCTDTVCELLDFSAPPCPAGDTILSAHLLANGNYRFETFAADSFLYAGTYNWSFGDGTSNADGSMTEHHQYATSGTYEVCLNYSSPYCTVSDCDTVVVDLCSVVTSIQTYREDSTLYFSLNEPNTAWTYSWIFPQGTPSSSASATPIITFPGEGSYYAYVEVTAPGCAMDTVSAIVSVPSQCNANFTYASNWSNIYFSAQDSFHLTQTGYSYYFDYGDGYVGTDWNHTYGAYGNYNVCLHVSTSSCVDSFCNSIEVNGPTGTVGGRVFKGGNAACDATVYLIREDITGHLIQVDTFLIIDSAGTGTSCYGYYYFEVPYGNYYFKAALNSADADYSSYLPTYFGDELNWADAVEVSFYGNLAMGYEISLIPGVNPGGPGFIGGNVSEGAGLAAVGNGEERAVGDPVANVQINLLTDNDVAVAYAYTDGNGRYTFNNLPLGAYKVFAEMLDKTPLSQVVTLTANNPSKDNVDVLVNSNSAVTGINDFADIKVEGLFPNPVNNNTTLQFTAKQNANAEMKITDMKGSVILSRQIEVNTGANKIDINLSNHVAGVYHLSITNNANSKTIKLIKAN